MEEKNSIKECRNTVILFRNITGKGRKIKLFRSLSMLLIITVILMSLLSCSSPYNNVPLTTTNETSAEPGSSDEGTRGKSAPIRVWWSSRQTLNPLLDRSLTGKAANDLIFDGLLERNDEGKLKYVLADSVLWSDNGLTLQIQLKSDTRFHNGSSVSATDAAICLAYVWSENGGPEFDPGLYFESGTEEPNESENTDHTENNNNENVDEKDNIDKEDKEEDETEDETEIPGDDNEIVNDYPQKPKPDEMLGSLNQIEIINEKELVCRFNEQQPAFISLLTFPIIPAQSWFQENQMSLIDGTGQYKMQKLDSEGSLWISYINEDIPDEKTSADTIILKQYKRVNEAMQALESDELDLVMLDSEQYPYYYTRNNLTLQRFTSNRSVFLAIQTEADAFSEPKDIIELKQHFSSLSLQKSELNIPGEINDLPLSVKMLPLEKSSNMYRDELDAITTEYASDRNLSLDTDIDSDINSDIDSNQISDAPLELIVSDREYLVSIASNISDELQSDGINLALSVLNSVDFADALNKGSYDLALCEAILTDDFNPAWLYGPNGSVQEIEWLSKKALSDYDSARLRLSWYDDMWYLPQQKNDEQKTESSDSIDKYGSLLTGTAARSPFAHLYLPYSALAYGDRVSGSSKPNIFHPYSGLEELWIWSGQ